MDTSITHIRPRFSFVVKQQKDEVINRLDSLLESSHDHVKGKIVQNHIILKMEEEQAHFWSPELNFRVEEDETNPDESIISGLIGPNPQVWTLFTFIYFSVGIIGFVITSYGIVKWNLGEFSTLLFAFPVAILFMLTAYKTGKYGEKLAEDQTDILKQFVRDAIRVSNANY